MKRLLFWLFPAFSLAASAQNYQVRNANDDYVLNVLTGKDNVWRNLHRIKRDNTGLYWLESLTELHTFDGVNWKSHKFKTANGRNINIRLNDLEITDDGSIWLATEGGLYVWDRRTENFIPLKQMHPGIGNVPYVANCIFKNGNDFIFISLSSDGFYFFNSRKKKLQHIVIDSAGRNEVPISISPVTTDRDGNFWGITSENRGIWHFNTTTGKIRRSWKGELFPFSAQRLQSGITGITYSQKEHVLWISYGERGILEKMYLPGGRSVFYSFTGDLQVWTDSTAPKRHQFTPVKIDRDGNEWLKIDGKYLVKMSPDPRDFVYLADDPEQLPLNNLSWFIPEKPASSLAGNENNNNILLWIGMDNQLAAVKKRNSIVRQIPWDTVSDYGIKAADYENANGRKNIFFEKGRKNDYFLLQQNPGRPKLICLDEDLQVKYAALNDKWKQYPAFFSNEFDPDTFYIAILRPGIEPLDFRNVVLKDFKIDLRTNRTMEKELDFRHRVYRYGSADAEGVSWLFSAGYLYAYDPRQDILDSIYICKPSEKGQFSLEYIKGFDYPTALHKNSSTFWIAFFTTRELYKINLKSRKIQKIFKSCFDRPDCRILSGVIDMYNFDTTRVYLQYAFSGMLINAFNDSVTHYTELSKQEFTDMGQNGAGIYRNWMAVVQPTEIHFLNTYSGRQKKLRVNEDFKGRLSQLNSRPLVNDRDEMIVMSSENKKFIVFNIDFQDPEKPGKVRFSDIRLNNRDISTDSLENLSALTVKYNNRNNIYFRFSDYSIDDQDKISYEYALHAGGDTTWSSIEGEPELSFINISPGKYHLLVRAKNEYGGYSPEITVLAVSVIPPFTRSIWFILVVVAGVAMILYGLYRYRLYQLGRLQTVRNNIASDLHDDIGSTLNSISIYSEVAKQQAGKDIPALDLIGLNSRRIIESMSDIVWTINPENDSFEKIISRMRSFAYQLLKAKKIEFTFEADEKLNGITLPMQVRKNFYLVFKEAITNLVKYSGADRVSILLKEEGRSIHLVIRDNGKGILISPETQGNGLLNMKRRAQEINASLHIASENGLGTGVELELKL